MKICIISGSRADYGLLEWPIKLMKDDPFFEVEIYKAWGSILAQTFSELRLKFAVKRPDIFMVLGDRHEILGAVTAAFLDRIPIAHLCGGDVTEGSYDDAMRDCISRMSTLHFVTSTSAMARLTHMGHRNVHLVGSTAIDYIKHADWKKDRPYPEKYVVVSYQPETIDGTNDVAEVLASLPDCMQVFLMPNNDRGSGEIRAAIKDHIRSNPLRIAHDNLPHDQFLNLIYHCEEFIGNSSAMLYEAPELGVKVRMIGKRQRGRVIPWGDGHASERIIKVLKYSHL